MKDSTFLSDKNTWASFMVFTLIINIFDSLLRGCFPVSGKHSLCSCGHSKHHGAEINAVMYGGEHADQLHGGLGADNFVQIATLNNTSGLTDEQTLINSGHLLV